MFILSLTEAYVKNTVATCNIYNEFLHLFDTGKVQVFENSFVLIPVGSIFHPRNFKPRYIGFKFHIESVQLTEDKATS